MKHLVSCIILFGFTATGPLAQSAKADNRQSAFVAQVGDGTTQSPVDSGKSGVELRANKDSSKATIKLSQTQSSGQDFSSWALTASSPISKTDDSTALATNDGFANAFTLELKFTQFLVNRNPLPQWAQHPDLYEKLQNGIAQGALSKGAVKTLEDGKKLDVGEDNILKYDPDDLPSYTERMWQSGPNYAWGAATTVGHQAYSYLSQPALESKTSNKVPYGARIFWSVIPSASTGLFTFSLEYQKAFKDAKTEGIVAPPDSNGVQKVKTGPIGPPIKNDKKLAALEWRRLINVPGFEKPVGMSLKANYDFEGKSWTFDLPLMLIRDAKGNLTGGLDFSWDEKSHRFSVGVIVGGAFGIF